MATMSIEQALRVANQHYDAGQLAEAESIYRQILNHEPGHAEALRMLGLLAFQVGRKTEALELIRRAIAVNPGAADYHSNLGVVLASLASFDEAIAAFRHALALAPRDPEASTNLANALQENGQLDEAIELYRQALAVRYDIPETHYNLGKALHEKGMFDEAIAGYRAAIALRPNYADAYNNLGTSLKETGQVSEAIAAYRQALSLRSNFPEAHYNLGGAMRQTGDTDQEIAAYRQAVALRPDYSDAYNNLGNALEEKGKGYEAIAAYRQALAAKSNFPEAYNNLGNVLLETSQLDEAIECYRQALALRPDYAEAHNNLGNALKESGRLDQALASYRRAASLNPEPRVAGNLLYVMHFSPDYGPREIYQEHARWNQRYARPMAGAIRPHVNDRNPHRGRQEFPPQPRGGDWKQNTAGGGCATRLRVGYVSPHLREHPVGRFMLPLMAHHDRGQFEIFCYYDIHYEDDITRQLKSGANVWRTTAGYTDEQLAQLVRADRIDVLVDLTMHLKGSRLLAFACKPAPVQVTYLAYCSTTGLETIDYRLTDPYLDPPEVAKGDTPNISEDRNAPVIDALPHYSERTIRLPRTYWCYPQPPNSPEVAALPARRNGYVTFGCLNNYSKVTAKVFESWCGLLGEVPGARLVLHAHEGSHRQLARDRMAARGIDAQRLQFNGFAPLGKYLEQYQQIDIALDPFPYGGGTTTCDSLWMGVPVLSLRGSTAVSRAGLSILSNVGLAELVADSAEGYVRIAVELAGDLPRLEQLRESLRQRLQASPVMDAPQFARDVESAYRGMWRKWCIE